MANIFLSVQLEIDIAEQTAYTVPAATTAVVIGMRFGNKTSGDITVQAILNRSGVDTYVVGAVTPIALGAALEGVQGSKLVMQAGDKLDVAGSADACADLTLSVMEVT